MTSHAPDALTIIQTSDRAIINWNSFSIGAPNSVTFTQPGIGAAVLNRVTGNTSSVIAGQLTGNGQVYLINPNGIAITRSGAVQVGGGFVASTLGISNSDFLSGNFNFLGGGASASVNNAGTILAGEGGYAALLGGTVANTGTISAPLGKVALGAAEHATLDLNGDGFLQVALPTAAVASSGQPLLDQSGQIIANGGRVELAAATVAQAIREAVYVPGSVSAHSVSGHQGLIVIDGGPGGVVNISGSVSTSGVTASAPAAAGGTIAVTGQSIMVGEAAHLDASGSSGGNVVLWSDQATDFRGRISATGLQGDGGEAEVSSHGWLNYLGTADLRSVQGRTGNLLLDPYDITISSAADTGAGFTAAANNTVINTTTLQNALATANVTVSTGASGTQNGDITVANAVTWGSGNQLTLSAANNIALNAPLAATGGGGIQLTAGNRVTLGSTLSVGAGGGTGVLLQAGDSIIGNAGSSITTQGQAIALNSDRDASGAGAIKLTGTTLTSNGGDVTLSGGAGTLSALQTTGYARGIASSGLNSGVLLDASSSISSGVGNVYVRGTGSTLAAADNNGIFVRNSSISTTTGSVNLAGTAGGNGTNIYQWGVLLNGNASITSSSGNIVLAGTGGTTAADQQAGVALDYATVTTGGAGAITVNATAPSTATAANTSGLRFFSNATLRSNGSGNITLNATAGSTPQAILAGLGTNAVGLGGLSGAYTGTIAVNTDSINLAVPTTFSGSGALIIQPLTASTTIGLGNSATGTLNLNATELGYLGNGFSSITIGSATGTGAVDVRTAAFTDPVTIRSGAGAGSITLNGALSTGSGTSAGTVTLLAGGAISGAAGSSITTQNQSITLTGAPVSGATNLASNGGLVTVNQTGSGTVSGVVSGAGGLTLAGGGTLGLSGANTYTGATTVSSGTLQAGSTSAFGSNSATTISSGATLDLAGYNNSIGSLTGAGTVTNSGGSAATLTAGGSNASTTFSGVIQDGTSATSLAKAGSGALTLTGTSNSYTGTTTINAGTLQVGNATSTRLGTGNVSVASGALLLFNTTGYHGGTTIGGNFTGAGTIEVAGSSSNSIARFAGDNSGFTGTVQIDAGARATLQSSTAGSSSAAFVVNGTLTPQVSSGTLQFGSLAGSGGVGLGGGTSNTTLQIGGNGLTTSFTGVIGNTSDSIAITKVGAGTLTLAGANTYTSGTSVNAGTLNLGSAGALGSSGTISFGGGTLQYSASNTTDYSARFGTTNGQARSIDTNGQNVTFATALGGSTSTLTKLDAGTLTLGGTNTFGGAAIIGAGTLSLNGSWNVGATTATTAVAAGATLSGAGVITAATLNHSGAGMLNLTGSNQVGTIATSGTIGAFTFNDAQSVSLGSINSGSNPMLVTTGSGADITLASGAVLSSSASGNAITLASGRNFFNNAGSGALVAGSGRWLVFSATPGADTFGSLNSGNTAVWNTTYGTVISQSGNRYVFSYQPTVTFTSINDNKTYGVNATAAVAADYTLSGIQAGVSGVYQGDSASTAYSGTPGVTSAGSAASATVAGSPYAINVGSGTLTGLNGYALAYASTGLLTVNPAALNIAASNQSKTYGSTANLGASAITTSGLLNSDSVSAVTLSSSGSVATADVAGSPYAIIGSGAVGSGLSNYTISYVNGQLTVTPATIAVTALGGSSIYGSAPTNPGLNATGLQNGQTVNVLTGLSNSFGITGASPVGNVALNVAGTLSNPNYTVGSTNSGIWTVSALPAAGAAIQPDWPSQLMLAASGHSTLCADSDNLSYNERFGYAMTHQADSRLDRVCQQHK